MPGYTHLQRAQPVSLAHHVLAYVEMLDRDRERFSQALRTHRRDAARRGCAGRDHAAASIHGSSRASWAFAASPDNSIDAVSDRDFAVDFLSAASLCAIHLSRMCEEIILWSSAEFGFVGYPG